ncbi:hypothetical protein ACQ4N7_20850 [Nodosilinea sp. AN01ver1]
MTQIFCDVDDFVNLVSGLVAYAYHSNGPSLGIPDYARQALPQAAF